jgi:type I restriction-modification system DNA methylase subunit
MPAPAKIKALVTRFQDHKEEYLAGHYNETQLRREFVDPFFKELGWDIDNEKGKSEAYKDVIHEDAIRIGGFHKAPDYCMRVGGIRKFFVEAKKPSVDIKSAVDPAFQIRRYAWSAKLPLSILTDFHEFAIYDCRIKPLAKDSAAVARIKYFTYEDYVEKWDEIAAIFSPRAIENGSFDKFAETSKLKKGTEEVDDAFLEDIEEWREMLAKNIAINNRKLSQRELNFAVQRTIDRIVFLRICEDRGAETYLNLQKETNGPHIYGRLKQLFRDADDRYNSGLFHFRDEKDQAETPDTLSLDLVIDDDVLKKIISHLYYPESPYEFSVLSADILGQVYERFLGKVIRLTEGHHAKVEEKPEVRKAGGVYYTPTYIVDYIVKHTVGKLLESKTPTQVAELKIVDPACGSGSFLLGAYQLLLDWHVQYYTEHDPKKWKKALTQGPKGDWRLSTAERKRILLDNIFGVDIDSQAVEVTKLSLLLKVLEGETQQSIQDQFSGMRERVLPDLGKNIQCGNSLIGPDFYDGQQRGLFEMDDEERFRINVFDWELAFPQVFGRKNPGFDAVIGNPPYVRQESLSSFKGYFEEHYESFNGVADLYVYFMEKGVKLLRDKGLFSIIVSSSFLRATYAEPLRRMLKKYSAVFRIVDFGGLPVFENAKDTYVCIPLLAKSGMPQKVEVTEVESLNNLDLHEYVKANHFHIPHERLSPEVWSLKSDDEAAVFEKITKAGKPLGEYVERKMFYGIKTGLNEAFVIDKETKERLIKKDKRSAELIHPLLGGEDIRRYVSRESGEWIIFTRRGVAIDNYPAIREHLENWKEELMPKKISSDKKGRKPGRYQWYEIQDDVAYYVAFEHPKIIFPDICKGPRFYYDTDGHYLANTAYCLGTDDLYLLGILNSKLFWFAISNISIPFGVRAGQYRYRLIYQYMEKVPIRVIDSHNSKEYAVREHLVSLVNQMLSLHKRAPKTPHEQESLKRQIEATDREIDKLIYELYELDEKEIDIIESSSKS